jgi:hypothetical protein
MLLALSRSGPVPAGIVTLVLVLVPFASGWWAVAAATSGPDRKRRLGYGLAAVLALVTWAGFVVAPLALLVVALAPGRWFGDVTRAAR